MTGSGQALTLRDIADLAGVHRPVVSMWRNRPQVRGVPMPFPEPSGVSHNTELFDRDEVVDWLERTGRGNNSEARLDAPALSVSGGSVLEELVTLLCLHARTGAELAGTTECDRTELAAEADPGGTFLRAEVAAAAPTPEALRYLDDLVEASYGPGDALDRLERGRLARDAGERGLTADAVDLVRTVAAAAGRHLDPEGVPLVHAGGVALLALALAEDFSRLVVPGTEASDRAALRRAAIRGIETTDVVTTPCVRMRSLLGVAPDAALDALDESVVELGADDVAVILGPAEIMCEALRDDREKNRAQTLRGGNLSLALRLPRGLWREAHRQALGIWVCVGGGGIERPLVADLAALTTYELDADDLAADVAGALAHGAARAFRYARPHELRLILSSRPVVPRGVLAPRLATTPVREYLERIQEATRVTADPVPSFDVLAVEAPGATVLRSRSLGELRETGYVALKRGSRIDPAHAEPGGTVAVLAADGGMDHVRLDPFDAAERYPRAARTEPGDVVFMATPRPAARVDSDGGALVASPSRILRLEENAGIGPHTLAAIINRLPDEQAEWQGWNVPLFDTADAARLEEVLAGAADYESELRSRSAAVQDLRRAVIDGVAAGAVTLTPQT